MLNGMRICLWKLLTYNEHTPDTASSAYINVWTAYFWMTKLNERFCVAPRLSLEVFVGYVSFANFAMQITSQISMQYHFVYNKMSNIWNGIVKYWILF